MRRKSDRISDEKFEKIDKIAPVGPDKVWNVIEISEHEVHESRWTRLIGAIKFRFFSALILILCCAAIGISAAGSAQVLARSSRGDDVTQLQIQLSRLDLYHDEIDGIFGKSTEVAVKEFQSRNNIDITGKVDDLTAKALSQVDEDDLGQTDLNTNENGRDTGQENNADESRIGPDQVNNADENRIESIADENLADENQIVEDKSNNSENNVEENSVESGRADATNYSPNIENVDTQISDAGKSSDQGDAVLLAGFIDAYSNGESYKDKVALASVILNRIADASFPSTIAGVIYQPNAFAKVGDEGGIHSPAETSIQAARDALNGWDPSGGALFFYDLTHDPEKELLDLQHLVNIEGYSFCR